MPATSPDGWLSRFPPAERARARAEYARMDGGVRIVPATQAHVEGMIGQLRAGDLAELAALGMTDRDGSSAGCTARSRSGPRWWATTFPGRCSASGQTARWPMKATRGC
jgi:hypothetical protein